MATRRVERVQEAIREVVSELVLRELKDPRAGFITITAVEVTPDLQVAKVLYTALGGETEQRRVQQCLVHARGFLRREVGQRLRLRYSPELVFTPDLGVKASLEVSRILEEIHREPRPETDAVGDAEDKT